MTSEAFMQMLHESPRHGSEEPEHMRQVKHVMRHIALLGTNLRASVALLCLPCSGDGVARRLLKTSVDHC